MDDSGGLTEAATKVARPRTTDPNPPGWETGAGILSHDGFPIDINFEGVSAGCFDPVGEFYAGLGVHFSGADELLQDDGCLNSFNYPPHSPVTVIGAQSGPSVTIDFDAVQGDVGIRYNTLAALTMTCYTGAGGTGGVVGVDAALFPNLANFGPSIAPPNELLRVTGAGILSCVITGLAGFYTVDDLFGDNLAAVNVPGVSCGGQAVTPGVTRFTFDGVTTWIGTAGPDVIATAADGIDNVLSLAGNDVVCTFGLPDVVDLGPDEDIVFLGDGRDTAFGKTGADQLFGEGGPDRLDGGHTPPGGSDPDVHNDLCAGGPGLDRFFLCETVVDTEQVLVK